ncbi:MAG: ATP-binding protein [Candidatus Woesearchaeota archaeon]
MVKTNPFTPKSGIGPRIFLDREEEICLFLKKIGEAKKGAQNHYVINGEWGIGKTTLLKYFKILAQKENCFAAYFPAREFKYGADDEEMVIHILQSIARNLPIKLDEKCSFFKIIKGFGVQFMGTGINLEFSSDKTKIIDAQNLLLDGLLHLWDDLKDKTKSLVVLIDDVQNWKDVNRLFTLLKNVLSSDEVTKNTKYLFLLSSTTCGWQQFIIRNHPIGRFFIPRIELKRFDKVSTIKLVKEFLKGTGVSFSYDVTNLVFEFTQGHLFEIHALCSSLYDCEINGKVTMEQWKGGLEKGLMYLGTSVFDNYLQVSEREKESLIALSFFNEPVELNKIACKCRELKYGIKNLNQYIRRLVEKKVIQNPSRGTYFTEDKLFREYVRTSFT